MPSFSSRSQKHLGSAVDPLQRLFAEVVRVFDCTVITGHRGEFAQTEAYSHGLSKVQWPNSKHNSKPSLAVDVAPYPVDWNDTNRFYYFAGYVKGMASRLDIPIRWGGDWDDDTQVSDQTFMDLVHFEYVGPSSNSAGVG